MGDVAWSCACGTMAGHITVDGGTRLVCHCDSCTRAQRHFGIEATRAEGVGVFQTTPDRFSVDQGLAELRLAQLSPKGAFRWYAQCCNRQIGVTGTTPKFAFVSIIDSVVAEPNELGRVRAHSFIPQHDGSTKSTGIGRVVLALVARAAGALTSGRWRDTVFFDVETRKPIVDPAILPKDAGRN